MPIVTMDGQAVTPPTGVETLGELLMGLGRRTGAAGRVVTGIRLDGVDQPAEIEPARIASRVGTFSSIEVNSSPAAELAAGCLADADTGLRTLSQICVAIARRLRAGDVQAANRDLSTLMQSVSTALTLAGAAMEVLARIPGRGDQARVLPAAETSRLIATLIESQQAADWIALADTLEYDFVPLLGTWADACLTSAAAARQA